MNKEDIKINSLYTMKVGKNTTAVRITQENPYGGWSGININTNKPIRIRTASRIRGIWKQDGTQSHTSPHVENKIQEPTDGSTSPKQTNVAKRGGLSAAVRILGEASQPLGCKEIVDRMLQQGYWTSNGKTPHATINAAIAREIKTKGELSRFKKVQRGLFALTA
jgi:hypothetical protein